MGKKFGSFFTLICLLGLLVSIVTPAYAHKVNIFAYAEEGKVFTESYFPDGRKVIDGKVEVYDSQENKLLEGKTNKEGLFDFKIPKQDDLKIVLIATMGHKNSFVISAAELAGDEDEGSIDTSSTANTEKETSVKKTSARRRHAPKKEPLPMAGVLGGLGFIFGLTALILQFTSKKK